MTTKTTQSDNMEPSNANGRTRPPLFFIVALVLTIVPLGLCWMLYEHHTSERRSYLMERNFRYLAHRGDYLHDTIRQYEKLFQSIDGAAFALVDQGDAETKESDSSVCEGPSNMTGQDGLVPPPKWLVKQLCQLPHVKRVVITRPKTEEVRTPAPFGIRARLSADTLVLDYHYAGWRKGLEHSPWTISAYLDLGSILHALPVEELFSYLLLADASGKVFHQSSSVLRPSEFIFSNIPVLPSKSVPKEKSEEAPAATPPFFGNFQVGDTEHLLIGQGGRWPHSQGNTDRSSSNVYYDFLVVGIVPAHDFTVEATSIPTSYLFTTVGLILMATLSLPYLRLRHMRSSDALSRRDVLTLLYCTALWVGAATFVVVTLNTLHHTETASESTLETTAKTINADFTDEFERAHNQLKELDNLCRQKCVTEGKVKGNGKLWSQGLSIVSDESIGSEHSYRLKLRESSTTSDIPFTFYELSKVLWIDAQGWKRVDWAWKPSNRRVRLDEREYFKAIESDKPFWIQSIRSWTTGDNFAIISTRSSVSVNGKDRFVVALEGKLPSVMDRAVPPGMGFALIDEHGAVQFHSDSHRNGRENFLLETDRNEKLQASLWTRQPMHFSGQYWGKERRFYIEPVSWKSTDQPDAFNNELSPNWFLVVYLDQVLIDTPLLEAGFFAVSIFVLYAALILGLGLFWSLINRLLQPENERLLWPHRNYTHSYLTVGILNVVLLGLYGVIQFYLLPTVGTSTDLFALVSLSMVILLPLALVIIVRSLLLRQKNSTLLPWLLGGRLPDYRFSYLFMFTSTFLLFAMLPAFHLFHMAYGEEMRLYAKFTQYDAQKDQQESQTKWKKHYSDQLVSVDKASLELFISERQKDRNQPKSAITALIFASGQEPPLSESLPVYSAFRRLLNGHFGTETARFLNTRKTSQKQSDATLLSLKILPQSYWAMIIVTLLIAVVFPSFLCKHGQNRLSGTSSACPYYWMVSLLLLSLALLTVLAHPAIGSQVLGMIAFGCITYGIPHLVTKRVFFLWEAQEPVGRPQEIELQWARCTPREKLLLAYLAQNRFLTAGNVDAAELIRKGLILMDPNPRLTKDVSEVRKFILEKSREEKIFETARAGGSDIWEQGIWTIKLGLMVLGSLVLFTQEEFRPMVAAALAPALPVLLKLPLGLDPAKLLMELVSKGKTAGT